MHDAPWLEQYDPGVPSSLRPYPEKTLVDVVRETAGRRPDHPSLRFKGRNLSCVELDRLSDELAVAFHALGVGARDRVTLLLPNCPQAVIAQLAAWKTGAIVSPVNPLCTAAELEHALRETGSEVAVVLTTFYAKVKKLQPATRLRRVVATNIKEYLPLVPRLLFTLLKERKEGHRAVLEEGDVWLGDLLDRVGGQRLFRSDPRPEDPALLLFSGGTTGLPKAVLSNHRSLLMAGMQVQSWVPQIGEWEDPNLAVFPFFHVAGNVAVLATALVGRNTVVLVPNPRDLDDLVATIARERPAVFGAVPTLFNALLSHPKVRKGKADFGSLKIVICGGAPMLEETRRRFTETTAVPMIDMYSLTEATLSAVAAPALGPGREGTVGLPLPDVKVRIVDPEDGTIDLPPGDVGEILLRAPQLMEGCWRRPDATAEALREGWLHTGDLGTLDEDGFVSVVDRKKDVIKPGGFQVWPTEVEKRILAHPDVAEVCVAGVPDSYQGEAVKAWIVVGEGASLDPEEVRTHCRQELAAYKVPKHVALRDTLPKSAIGKVLRRELVREHPSLADAS